MRQTRTTKGVYMTIHIRDKQRAHDTMLIFDIQKNGRRTRITSGITYTAPEERSAAYTAAHAVLRHSEKDLYRRSEPRRVHPLTLGDVVMQIQSGTNRQRIALYRYMITYEIAAIPADDLEPETLTGFIHALSRHCKPGTVRRYAAILKTCLTRAYESGRITKNPGVLVRVPRPTDDGRMKGLSASELQRLHYSECDNDIIKRAFLFACETGLRLSDIARITHLQICGNVLDFVQHKTGRRVTIPLTPFARTLIWPCPCEGPIFPLPHPSTVNRVLTQWGKVAGCTQKLTFHVARHTCARRLVDSGVPVPVVGKILGHRSLASTLQYVRPADSDVVKAIECLSLAAPSPDAG